MNKRSAQHCDSKSFLTGQFSYINCDRISSFIGRLEWLIWVTNAVMRKPAACHSFTVSTIPAHQIKELKRTGTYMCGNVVETVEWQQACRHALRGAINLNLRPNNIGQELVTFRSVSDWRFINALAAGRPFLHVHIYCSHSYKFLMSLSLFVIEWEQEWTWNGLCLAARIRYAWILKLRLNYIDHSMVTFRSVSASENSNATRTTPHAETQFHCPRSGYHR